MLDDDKETVLADLTRPGQRVVLLRGGDGGFGNAHYKSSTNRAPRRADPGWPGQELWVWLRLKLIADAGLVGLPNAGKSTLLSRLSHARPKIADYPFTTLHPQLGVVRLDDETEFVLADLPGLIEGASEGAGLGTRFLGHVERCAVILHLIDGTEEDVVGAYRTIRASWPTTATASPTSRRSSASTRSTRSTRRRSTKNAARWPAPRGPARTVLPLSGVSGAGLPPNCSARVFAAIRERARRSRSTRGCRAPSMTIAPRRIAASALSRCGRDRLRAHRAAGEGRGGRQRGIRR